MPQVPPGSRHSVVLRVPGQLERVAEQADHTGHVGGGGEEVAGALQVGSRGESTNSRVSLCGYVWVRACVYASVVYVWVSV